MENLTPEEISSLSSEELSMKLMECVQHFKEQAAIAAEQVAKCEQMLTEVDNGIQTARHFLAQACTSELRLKIKQHLDKLLAVRTEIKETLESSRASLKEARQTVRDTRDSKSVRKWMQHLAEGNNNRKLK